MDRKFWVVGATLSNMGVNDDEVREMNRLACGYITADAAFDDPAKALIEFGRRCGIIEAFANEALVNPDLSWLSSERVARMEPSSFVIAHRKDYDAMRGAVVWIRVTYSQL